MISNVSSSIIRWKFSKISTYVVANSVRGMRVRRSRSAVPARKSIKIGTSSRNVGHANSHACASRRFVATASSCIARAIEFRFCVLAPVGQIFRNNVTYTTVDHVARWIKEGSWLPAIRAFNLAHEPFGSRLPPRTCPALYP